MNPAAENYFRSRPTCKYPLSIACLCKVKFEAIANAQKMLLYRSNFFEPALSRSTWRGCSARSSVSFKVAGL